MDTKARTRSKKKKSRNKSAKSKQAPAPQKTCGRSGCKEMSNNAASQCKKCGFFFKGDKWSEQNKSLLEDLKDAKDCVKILKEENSELKSKGAVAAYRKDMTIRTQAAVTRQSKRQSKDLEDAKDRIKILNGKLLGVLAKNKLASKREGAVNIGRDKLTYIAATVLSLEMDLEGEIPDNLDDDEVLYDKWHDSFINLLEKAQYPPKLNRNIAWCEDDKYIDGHYDDAELYLAYKRMALNLGELSTFVFRLFPEYKDDDVWRTKGGSFEDRFDLVKKHVHKTIPLRLDDNSDQSSDDDNKVGDFGLSYDSDDVNIDDV